jgi:hypothetical protein
MKVDMSHQNAEKAPRRCVDIARGLVPARDGKAQKAVLVSCRLFTFTTSRPPPNRQAEASSLLKQQARPLPQASSFHCNPPRPFASYLSPIDEYQLTILLQR